MPWIGVFFAGLIIGTLIGVMLGGMVGKGQATPTPVATEAPATSTATPQATPTSPPTPTPTAISPPPQGVQPGQIAPDFTLKDLAGQEVRLSDSRGKVVVLVFWKDTDTASKAMMPYLSEFYQEHKGDPNLTLLTINSSSSPDAVKPLADVSHWTFPILLDEGGQQSGQYMVDFWPTTFFLNQQGIIRDRVSAVLNPEQLNEHVNAVK